MVAPSSFHHACTRRQENRTPTGLRGKGWKMDKITRSEAHGAGMDRYFTGEPCKFGHRAQRYVSTRNCVECMAQRTDPRWPKKPPSSSVLRITVAVPRSHVAAIKELAAAFCALAATSGSGPATPTPGGALVRGAAERTAGVRGGAPAGARTRGAPR